MELVTLQEKCDAWRDRADSLANEMDELKSLLAQLSMDKLAAEEQLEQHLKVKQEEYILILCVAANFLRPNFFYKNCAI